MPIIPTPIVKGNPPPIRSAFLHDFVGGINFRDDSYALQPNEMSDCLDVDLRAQGGVARRKSFRPTGAAGNDTTKRLQLLRHQTEFGASDLGMVVAGGVRASDGNDGLFIWSSGNFTEGTAGNTTQMFATNSLQNGNLWSAASMANVTDASLVNNMYIHRDNRTPVQALLATGTLSSALTDAYGHYNDTGIPAGGTNPLADIVVTHLNYLFHANTYENSVEHSSRIRWSFAGAPGDYATNDFIDVGLGVDNDRIVGMVSAFGALFIFKQRSTWMLTGYASANFAINEISHNIGIPNKNACCASQYGVTFFDQNLGMHQITRVRGPSGRVWMAEPMWPKLYQAMTDGRLTFAPNGVQVAWVGSRLVVSGLQWAPNTFANRTFVMDETVGPGWTVYGVGFDLVAAFIPAIGQPIMIGAGGGNNKNHVHMQGTSTVATDNFDHATETTFAAYFLSSWINGGDPSLKKRFRRFSLVFDNQPPNYPMIVTAYKNWTTTGLPSRTFVLQGNEIPPGTLWNGSYWGQGQWGSAIPTFDAINVRGGTIGTAYAVALRVQGPADRDWFVDQITVRFVPMRIN